MLSSSMLTVILSSACLKGILSTPLPKSLVNIVRVSSLHNLDLDGKFCDAKCPGAGSCTSLPETTNSVIYVWSSSSAAAPAAQAFVKYLREAATYQVLCLVWPPCRAFQREVSSIPGWELDDAGPSSFWGQQPSPSYRCVPFHSPVWACFSGWVAGNPGCCYLVSANIFDRLKTFMWSILILPTWHFLGEKYPVGNFSINCNQHIWILPR